MATCVPWGKRAWGNTVNDLSRQVEIVTDKPHSTQEDHHCEEEPERARGASFSITSTVT